MYCFSSKRFASRRTTLTLGAFMILLVLALPAFAIYPQLSIALNGVTTNGTTPAGDAKVDQSRYPAVNPVLQVRVRNVNLPDGTRLDVYLGGSDPIPGQFVGTLIIQSHQGQATISVPFQVGRNDDLVLKNGSTVVLYQFAAWKT